MSHHHPPHEPAEVGRIAQALLNIPVMASALALCYLGLWLAQPEAPPVRSATPSTDAIAVADPPAADEAITPPR